MIKYNSKTIKYSIKTIIFLSAFLLFFRIENSVIVIEIRLNESSN